MNIIRIVAIILAIAGTATLVWFWFGQGRHSAISVTPTATVTVGAATFRVELAETMLRQAAGLSGRSPLAEDEGMLFIFSGKASQTFWMKGMRFPLDFVWIAEGVVVGVTENAPADNGLLTYGSPGPVDMVLEINAGEVAKKGIRKGQNVIVER